MSRVLQVFSWVLCAVPLIGVAEFVLHVKQTSDVVPGSDWEEAKGAVRADFHADDLVLFAPFWADPIGREHFGDELAGMKREARPDETRFARVFEVSIRGAHRDEIAGWKKVSEKNVGKITIGLYENPSPAKPKTDLVDLLNASGASVSRIDKGVEQPCAFQHGQGQPGGLGVPQGPAIPGDKFSCPGGGYVGVAVEHALDHHPHLCIFATPPGGPSAIRIRFKDVTFGESIHGHTGVQWVDERSAAGERILTTFSAFDRPLGTAIHRPGAGWVFFELPTPELAGKKGELVADVSGGQKHYCFEADTR